MSYRALVSIDPCAEQGIIEAVSGNFLCSSDPYQGSSIGPKFPWKACDDRFRLASPVSFPQADFALMISFGGHLGGLSAGKEVSGILYQAHLAATDVFDTRRECHRGTGSAYQPDRDENRCFECSSCTVKLGLHSIRNAWVGLIDAARRAGIQAATSATRTITIGTRVNVTVSCGEIP